MSKLGKFAAACAAVVCAFGALAADIVVDTAGGEGVYKTLSEAFAAAKELSATQTPTVFIKDGGYPFTETITLDYPVVVTGESRDGVQLTGTNLNAQAILVKHADVEISNLTIRGVQGPTNKEKISGLAMYMSAGYMHDCTFIHNRFRANYSYGGGLYLAGGLVENCLFTENGGGNYGIEGGGVKMTGGTLSGCTVKSNDQGNTASNGTGISMSGGTVTNCFISGNGTAQGGGGGIRISGGLVTHSRITNNGSTGNGNAGAGIYISGGTVQNCLIYGNKSSTSAAGVHMANGTVQNCTIAGNIAASATTSCPGVKQENGTVRNCIVYGNSNGKDGWVMGSVYKTGGTFSYSVTDVAVTGTGNLAANPKFRDAENEDFHIQMGSAAIGAATPLAAVPYDFDGVVRSETAPTCGAFEYVRAGGALRAAIVNSQADYPEGASPTMTVMLEGDNLDNLTYAWYLDGSGEVYSTEETLTITEATPGKHSVRLVVSNGVDAPAEDSIVDAIEVHPLHVYVNDKNEGEAYPYSTPETAAKSISAAYDVLWTSDSSTGIVEIAAGDYSLAKTVTLSKPVVLFGAGTNATKVSASGLSSSAFVLSNSKSVVSNLHLTVGSFQTHGGGVNMSAGLVSDLYITGARQSYYNYTGGGANISGGTFRNSTVNDCTGTYTGNSGNGIYMSAGTVSNSVIRSCTAPASGGGGVRIAGGTLTHCRIVSCGKSGNAGGGVHITGGTMQNCLVYKCTGTSATQAAGVHNEGGTVRYCTIYGNVSSADSLGCSGIKQTKGTAVNNIIWGNGPDGTTHGSASVTGGTFVSNVVDLALASYASNVVGDPKFKNAASNDFHIAGASAARGAASTAYRIAFDFDGVERDYDAPSAGAYEYVKGSDPLSVDIVCAAAIKVETPMTLTAVPENAADEAALGYRWQVDGTDAGTTKTIVVENLATGVHTAEVWVVEDGVETKCVKPAEFRVQPVQVYVRPASNDATPVYPYDTPVTAATNLGEAVKALWMSADTTSRVDLAAGVHRVMGSGLSIATPVVIRGAGRDATVLTGSNSTRLFRLDSAGAELSHLCISNFYYDAGILENGAIWLTKGFVHDVHVTRISTSGHYYSGVCLYMEGGRAEDCVFDTCNAAGRTGHGGAMNMSGGVADRIRIFGATGNITAAAAAAWMSGSAELRNALITDCNSDWTEVDGGLIINASGSSKIINCTITGNRRAGSLSMVKLSESAKMVNTIVSNGGTAEEIQGVTPSNVRNCCWPTATGEGNIAEEPRFRNAERGDYRIRVSSPCVDKGDWTYLGATKDELRTMCDLNGSPRLRGESVDMGCCENPQTGLMLIMR